MADEQQPAEQDDSRKLFKDVWGEAPAGDYPAGRGETLDMPPLVEREMGSVRLDQLERSLKEARSEIDQLRTSLREISSTIERIAHRLQLDGYTEAT